MNGAVLVAVAVCAVVDHGGGAGGESDERELHVVECLCFRSCFFVVEKANVVNQVGWYSRKSYQTVNLCWIEEEKNKKSFGGGCGWSL